MGRPEIDERDNGGTGVFENLPTDIQRRTEKERNLDLGSFTLIELPKLDIPGITQAAKIWQELEGDLPYSLKNVTTTEEILGDKLCEYTKIKLMDDVKKKYPELNRSVLNFYFELFLKERTRQWNFNGGLIAIEDERMLVSEANNRSRMSLEEVDKLILKNRETILDRVREANPNLKGLNLNTVSVGLPTIAELVSFEKMGLRVVSDNRKILTSTKVVTGITNEKISLVCNLQAYTGQEISFLRHGEKSAYDVSFFPIARVMRSL